MVTSAQISLVIYQSQVAITTQGYSLMQKEEYSQSVDGTYYKLFKCINYINALQDPNVNLYLTNVQQEFIYKCLIQSLNLNNYPVSGVPVTIPNVVSILTGIPGVAGAPGATGATGPAGLATDFAVNNTSVTSVVDSFNISSAIAARWDYVVINAALDQRAGTIWGQWNAAGTLQTSSDLSTDDITGSTLGITLGISIAGATVQLVATITAGSPWSIKGSRYFIPNNGAGTGPIGSVLTNGFIYVGNSSNVATGVLPSGALSLTNTGVATINNNYIVDSMVNSTAAINVTKLIALTPGQVAITNGSGFLTTSTITAANLLFFDISSSLTSQLAAKLADPMTTIGDIIIRNGSNVTSRLAAGTNGFVLTLSSGIPAWIAPAGGVSGLTANYIPYANSPTNLINSVISQSGGNINLAGGLTVTGTSEIDGGFRTLASGIYYFKTTVSFSSVNMYHSGGGSGTLSTIIAHGLGSTSSKIKSINIMIFNDSGSIYVFLHSSGTIATSGGRITGIDSTNIYIAWLDTCLFDTASFSSLATSPRGYATIEYST